MKYRKAAIIVTLLLGVGAIAKGSYIHLKAQLAQHFLEHAWTQGISRNHATKPWPWADTRAIARLAVPELGVSLIVMEGVSGEAMAFGPGMTETQGTTHQKVVVIGGHRDTHMAFLRNIQPGDDLQLEKIDGSIESYVVEQTLISNVESEKLQINKFENSLVLVTCYPFNALVPGGPLRYVAIARQRRVISNPV